MRVTVVGSVCLSVCVSVKSHLTYGASVHPENSVTYSAGNEGQKYCGVFSETVPLQRYGTCCIVPLPVQSDIFTPRKTRMRIFDNASCARACAFACACVVAIEQQPEP